MDLGPWAFRKSCHKHKGEVRDRPTPGLPNLCHNPDKQLAWQAPYPPPFTLPAPHAPSSCQVVRASCNPACDPQMAMAKSWCKVSPIACSAYCLPRIEHPASSASSPGPCNRLTVRARHNWSKQQGSRLAFLEVLGFLVEESGAAVVASNA